MKWNISVIRGEETKKYFVSTGEGMQNYKPYNLLIYIKKLCEVMSKKVRVLYYINKRIRVKYYMLNYIWK